MVPSAVVEAIRSPIPRSHPTNATRSGFQPSQNWHVAELATRALAGKMLKLSSAKRGQLVGQVNRVPCRVGRSDERRTVLIAFEPSSRHTAAQLVSQRGAPSAHLAAASRPALRDPRVGGSSPSSGIKNALQTNGFCSRSVYYSRPIGTGWVPQPTSQCVVLSRSRPIRQAPRDAFRSPSSSRRRRLSDRRPRRSVRRVRGGPTRALRTSTARFTRERSQVSKPAAPMRRKCWK